MALLSIDILRDEVARRLGSILQGAVWSLDDDSYGHRGHVAVKDNSSFGAVTHCTLVIISPFFSEMTLLKRHKIVQETLGTGFFESLHSLSLKLKAPDEGGSEALRGEI